jgi:hypothetical protein
MNFNLSNTHRLKLIILIGLFIGFGLSTSGCNKMMKAYKDVQNDTSIVEKNKQSSKHIADHVSHVDDIIIEPTFDWKTTHDINLNLSVSQHQDVKPGVVVTLYYKDAVSLKPKQMLKGVTNSQGRLVSYFSVPSYVRELVAKTHVSGDKTFTIPLSSDNLSYNLAL